MKWEVKTKYERRHAPVKLSFNLMEDTERQPKLIGPEMFQTRRLLTMTARTEFWSNNAQLKQKTRQAEKVARSYIFKDMLHIVHQIKLESDSQEVFALADDLISRMEGKDNG